MNDLARLEKENNSKEASLAAFVALINQKEITPEFKALILYEAAKIAFEISKWEDCRKYSTSPEIKLLPVKVRFQCEFLAAQSLYQSGNKSEGMAELEAINWNKLYYNFIQETQIFLAQWYFIEGKNKHAVDLMVNVTIMAPKSKYSAEAFYHLGNYALRLKKEEKAVDYFDSSAACGDSLEYAKLSIQMVASLKKLFELRDKSKKDTSLQDLSNEFYIAELFLFQLDNPDSAVRHMNNIVTDTTKDSIYSIKAAYARAYITDEFTDSDTTADSL